MIDEIMCRLFESGDAGVTRKTVTDDDDIELLRYRLAQRPVRRFRIVQVCVNIALS